MRLTRRWLKATAITTALIGLCSIFSIAALRMKNAWDKTLSETQSADFLTDRAAMRQYLDDALPPAITVEVPEFLRRTPGGKHITYGLVDDTICPGGVWEFNDRSRESMIMCHDEKQSIDLWSVQVRDGVPDFANAPRDSFNKMLNIDERTETSIHEGCKIARSALSFLRMGWKPGFVEAFKEKHCGRWPGLF
jgi:hypothetical protein